MLKTLLDQYDVLMEEVDLLTELIIAASDSPVPLSQDQIDQALGIDAG